MNKVIVVSRQNFIDIFGLRFILTIIGLLLFVMMGCNNTAVSPDPGITIEQTKPSLEAACSDSFVAHDLTHVTTVNSQPVTMFDSNGTGTGINV